MVFFINTGANEYYTTDPVRSRLVEMGVNEWQIRFGKDWNDWDYNDVVLTLKLIPASPAPSWDHVQITNDDSNQYFPSWSPDGSRIAFEDDSGSPGYWNVWTMDTSGGARHQLTTGEGRGPLFSPDNTT